MEALIGSKKELAIALSKLQVFENPKVNLEQYPTDGEIAADILWQMMMRNEIQGKHVADLGCGTGILGIGAYLVGARHITFVDVDDNALRTLKKNIDEYPELPLEHYDIICTGINTLPTPEEPVDIVIMNPPFGTRDEHADLLFLTKALEISPVVYSMHKTSTISYIHDWLKRNEAKVVNSWKFQMPIKQTFSHQTKKIQRIDVTFLCIKRNE